MRQLFISLLVFFIFTSVGFSQKNWVDRRATRAYSNPNTSAIEKDVKLKRLSTYFSKNSSVNYYLACNKLDQIAALTTDAKKITAYKKALNYSKKWAKYQVDRDTLSGGLLEQKMKSSLLILLQAKLDDAVEDELLALSTPFLSTNPSLNVNLVSQLLKGVILNDTISGLPTNALVFPIFRPKEEALFLELLNKARKEKGLSPLILDEDLSRACRYHAEDMAREDYFSHSSQDRTPNGLVYVAQTFDRIQIFAPFCTSCSENIAAGNDDARNTYKQWYESPGHYRNMFNPNAKKIGVGCAYNGESTYGSYWVMNTSE